MRAVGGLLVLASLLPGYLLLRGSGGIAAGQFLEAGPWLALSGVLALGAVLLLALLLTPFARPAEARLLGMLARPTEVRIAGIAAVTATLGAGAFSLLALGGGPYLVDGMSLLFQARLLSAGALELTTQLPVEFSYYQYLAPSTSGWASQYPPGYPAVLALATLVGAPWLVGPLLHGATAWLGVRFVGILHPGDRAVTVVAAALFALSPLALPLAGSFATHTPAALLGLLAIVCALRAGAGGAAVRSGVAAGLAVGILATIRPLTAVVVALVAGMAWWSGFGVASRPGRRALRFPVAATLAGLPPVAALLWYNACLFGAPLTFGYTAAQGPAHGLGFHTDPWGARYGPLEAIAYTMTELRALGAEIAGVPLPLVALIGAALALWASSERRHWLPLAWGGGLVVAGFFYWHHDLSMGPRLLSDAAPAWFVLAAWALVTTARRLAARFPEKGRAYLSGLGLACLLAAVVATGVRYQGYQRGAQGRDLLVRTAPAGTLVFVHDSWESRLAARLAALRFRDDQIRVVLGAWPTCALHTTLGHVEEGRLRREALAVDPGVAARLTVRTMPSGSSVRVLPEEELSVDCLREAESDFAGVTGLPQRSWRGDLPGAERGRTMYLRDLGPERNRRALGVYPDREPFVLLRESAASQPLLLPYEEGVARLWNRGSQAP